MSKLNVTFVIPALHHGGTNRVLCDLLPMLSKDKYEITILCLKSHNDDNNYYYEQFNQISKLFFLPTKYDRFLHSRIALLVHAVFLRFFKSSLFLNLLCKYASCKITSLIKPDVVVAFEESRPSDFCQFFKCRKVLWMHCDYKLYKKDRRPLWSNEIRKYSSYDKIVCVSDYTAKSFCSFFPNLKDKVIAIHNPINVQRIKTMANAPIKCDAFLNSDFTILSIGRYVDVKQFHLIPDIVSEMEHKNVPYVNYRWYIIGSGDEDLIKLTHEKIKRHRIENKVFLLGAVDNPYPFIKNSNLVVCTSYSEAYPCVINEAKSLGIKVVANDFESACEIIDDNSGVVVEFDRIADTILGIIRDNEKDNTKITLGNNNDLIISQVEDLIENNID